MAYTPGNEVGVFPHGSQFEGGESAYLCVFFGCADIAASSHPGYPIGQSWEWVDQTADRLANEVQGSGSFETSQGASLQNEYDALSNLHLTFKALSIGTPPSNSVAIEAIKSSINLGVPVLLCGEEKGFVDAATGQVDYTWTPTGNHCIVVSGYTADGNLLVRDYAATRLGSGAGSLRTYLADKVVPVSATAVYPYWYNSNQNVPGSDWHDDGTTLTCPDGKVFVKGFRQYVLEHRWDAKDVALENEHGNENPILHNETVGSGTSQCTRDHYFFWTEKVGVICEQQLGAEIFALQQRLSSPPTVQEAPQPVKALTFSEIGQALKETASAEGLPVATLLMQLFSEAQSGTTTQPTAQTSPQPSESAPPPDPG